MVSTVEFFYLAFALATTVGIFSWKISAWLERERSIKAIDGRIKWMHDGKVSFADFPFTVIDLIHDAQIAPWSKELLDGADCYLPHHRFGRIRPLPERGNYLGMR